jgi:aerobic-type carbon monoxide dehydrogenase small subunit (CoxS/CutS family)
MRKTIHFTLNGQPKSLVLDRERMLLWVLRTDFGLTGAKYGCGEGLCGACTVLVNNEAVRSCQFPVEDVDGKEIVTIEGLARNGRLHPLQEAFVNHDALQCGFCTPGMILTAYSLLKGNPQPSLEQITEAMDENLCRCGSHQRIIRAIQDAAGQMRGGAVP